MCGIAGVTGVNPREPVARMVNAMAHRGPDDRGVHLDDRIGLGMTRLSIIDTSVAGHQPMASADRAAWIVYNGETFNFRAERQRLESSGHQFASHSDTEVVLALYRSEGTAFLGKLRGMFALAIWDAHESTLLLARDRLGIKPLYYASLSNGDLIFASELKALVASGLVEPQIDRESLRSLLTYGAVSGPRTILRGVHALPPAHSLAWHDGRVTIAPYWTLPAETVTAPPFADAVAELRERLREAVRLSLESDVDLGVFLSGGADSAAVLAMMADLGHREVSAYCVGFDTDGSASDELRDARTTADFFGARFHGTRVTGTDVDAAFDRFIWALDQPSVDGLNSYLVSAQAGRDVKVALSGLGGDELFGGYGRTAQSVWRGSGWPAAAGRTLLKGWRAANGSRPADGWRGMVERRLALADPFESYSAARRLFTEADVDALMGESSAPPDLRAFDTAAEADPVLRTGVLDLRTFVPFQLLRDMDAVAMAHSLEVRFPLLDHELVTWALQLPAAYKYAPRKRPKTYREEEFSYATSGAKRIFLAALKDVLPPDLPLRRKQGFKLPMASWLSGSLRPRVDAALDGAADSLVSADAVRGIREAFSSGSAAWPHVWLLLVLHAWQRSLAGLRDSTFMYAAH